MTACQKEADGVTDIVFTNLTSGKLNLLVGEEFKVKCLVLPETMQETAEIEWTTSDKNVARVRRGTIQAEGPGEAVITAACGNVATSVQVTVEAVQVTDLDFPTDAIEVYLGARVAVKFENVTPANASLTTVEWKVVDYGNGDATVEAADDCIYITGTEEGVVDLYGYIDGEELGHQEIEIKERIPVTSVSVSLSKQSVSFGESLTFSTNVQPSNASLKDVTVTLFPSSLATVNGNTIKAGQQAGKVTVTATADGVSGSAEFEILPPPLTLSIQSDLKGANFLSPDKSVADYLDKGQLTLTANYDLDLSSAVWKSSDPAIVSVDNTGKVTGVGHGYATISATYDGKEVSTVVRSVKKSSFSVYTYKSGDSAKTPVTSFKSPYKQIMFKCADPAFIGDKEGMQYLIESNVYQITPGASTPFAAHMETDDCVVNALSAGTGTVTLSAFGGKSTTVSVTMKVGSLTFIGQQTGKNYGTVQKGGSLTINKVDLDSRPGLGNIEGIEVWRNVGSGKDNSSLCDSGYLTWKGDKVSYDPFDYGVLNIYLSGTYVITLTEFDPGFSVTLTINNPQI